MSYTAREFSHAVAVTKIPWENNTSVRRNPWNKVLSKPFRITETSNCTFSRRAHLCHFHKKFVDRVACMMAFLNNGMYAETLKIHLPKASEVSSSFALTASQ